MTGSIAEIPLPDLLQLFGASKKSGVLTITSGPHRGEVFLNEGKIEFASVDANYDEKSFVVSRDGQAGFLDFETTKPEKVPAELAEMFSTVPTAKGGVLVVYGWTMAEDLVKLGLR